MLAFVQAVVTRVFLQYVELMRKVQLTYWYLTTSLSPNFPASSMSCASNHVFGGVPAQSKGYQCLLTNVPICL